MKKIFLILPVFLLLAAACGNNAATPTSQTPAAQPQTQSQGQQPPTANQNPPFNTVKIALTAQNNSGESGSITITEVAGKAKVAVSLSGQPAGAIQPSHVHFGSCTQLGDVKYPLASVIGGSSVTTLSVSMAQLLSQPFAVNVHKSTSQIGVYVACGDSLNLVKSISQDSGM